MRHASSDSNTSTIDWMAELQSLLRVLVFFSSQSCTPCYRPSQPPIKWDTGTLSSHKAAGMYADQSPLRAQPFS
jgi:hypothetical protein